MTVNDIYSFLNKLFPVTDAMDFDNVGLLVGDSNKQVKKVLICLDCTLEAISVAIQRQCDLIVTHHPVIFQPLTTVLRGSAQYELIKNDISVISMHTNLDIGENGVNDNLCNVLEMENTENITANDGYTVKIGEIKPKSPEDFALFIKEKLGGGVKYVAGKSPITKVLVCGGSGGNYIDDAVSLGADALVTADIKHHQFLTASDNDISLFDAGHFNTEDIIVEPLSKMLSDQFDDIEFSTFHSQVIKFE